MTIPLLPESAPFTASQRAWLNGFFAGVLGISDGAVTSGFSNGHVAASATSIALPEVAAEEEFPWHDASLSIEERVALAEGRPFERKLMAAMAQLDCGACGYLCQTYSEAVALGEEKNLNRCTPGGKETSRKLKELVSIQGSVTTNGAVSKTILANGNGSSTITNNGSAMSSVVVGPKFSRTSPFPARLISSQPLNRPGSQKDTRHISIDLSGSGLSYKPGDALGVFPENCPELVGEILRELGVPERLDIRSALTHQYSLGRPGDDLIERLVECASDPDEADHLTRLRDGEDEWIDTADLLDVLQRHPSARMEADEFLTLLATLQPRLYSISSSLRAHPDEVHLTVGVVRYSRDERLRKGVASTFLGERLVPGGEVKVFMHPSHRFQLPDRGDTPMIMVGPGTGIAPFRAFLEERRAVGTSGKNWLFFGDQGRATDFLYEAELQDFQKAGVLTRLDLAFSRDQAEKVYVQTRMLERARELWEWLEGGAHFYVCGDAKRMASDVDRALQQVVASQGNLSTEAAKSYISGLTKSGRYQRDVY